METKSISLGALNVPCTTFIVRGLILSTKQNLQSDTFTCNARTIGALMSSI